MNSYIKLGIAACLPVLLTVIIQLIKRKEYDSKRNYYISQAVIGVLFGIVAIIGTEWGIPLDGAQVNCRDAAPLCAGLFFGPWAGIIAGIIGGVERWIAVAWGVGSYTRVACSVSTAIAGVYAAALRKYMFDDKKPSWFLSLAIGLVMEVFHLTMVFITNFSTATKAAAIVKICAAPMLIANSLSVMCASLILTVLAKDKIEVIKGKHQISSIIQKWLLLAVAVAFLMTTLFMYLLQSNLTNINTTHLLQYTIEDLGGCIKDAADDDLLSLGKKVAAAYQGKGYSVYQLQGLYDVSEISYIDENGIIQESTNPSFIGFDMASGEQSAEFLCLLEDADSYVQSYGPISYDETISRKYCGVRLKSGFLQVGYNTEQFQRGITSTIKSAADNRRIGETGYVFVINESGALVSRPISYNNNSVRGTKVEQATFNYEPYELFRMTILNEDCYCMYASAEGYTVFAVYPYAEAEQNLEISLYTNTFLEILVFAIVFGIIYFLIKFVIVDKMHKVNNSLAEITGGNLNVSVDVRSSDEFASLSDDINGTVATLKHYIDEAAARIDKELEFAKNIQYSALPNVFPAFPKRKDFDIYARMDTAKEVGGDFYDFYMTDECTLNFLIADVSGKGIPAALFMMRAKTQLKSLTESKIEINEVFTKGNSGLCEGNDANMFVTAWQGKINLETGYLEFANGGHNQPLVKKYNGQFEYLKTRPGFVLAGMDGVKYKKQELQLEPGDIIFLYTDGVTEATDANNELYGEERLQAILNSKEFADMKELCDTVKEDVDKFVGDAPQFDDITMVGFKFNGTQQKRIHHDEARIENIAEVTEFVEGELEKLDCPMKDVMTISIAIDELYSNIANYSYKGKEVPGPATVIVEEIHEPQHGVQLIFIDEGVPYNPLKKDDPDITLSLEERGIGGLGIFMVKKSMDNMIYEYKNDRNIVTIQKYF